jgi:hypothetical protein
VKFLQSLFNRKPGRFWTEAAHRKDLVSQLEMTPQTLDQLRTLGVSADKALSLEYFFYTKHSRESRGTGRGAPEQPGLLARTPAVRLQQARIDRHRLDDEDAHE